VIGIFRHARYFRRERLDLRAERFTTAFAARMAEPSEAPRFNIEFATCENCRFDFAVVALRVNREASDGPHGMATCYPSVVVPTMR
jgi:hypothetical protein